MSSPDLLRALVDPARPCFLFGCTPPREGTSELEARKVCALFTARSAVLATDGFVIYDLQDEASRTALARPFPFRKTMDAALFASYFFAQSGKRCVVYKSVMENSPEGFDEWLTHSVETLGHRAYTLVGSPSSAHAGSGLTLLGACKRVTARGSGLGYGCVAIAERHTAKGSEHQNMVNKSEAGASWFITQGIFDATPISRLINDYGELCKSKKITPRKVILTFAPCGRAKTLDFIRWLGMFVPAELETRIFAASNPVHESLAALKEVLIAVLRATAGSGVPLGLNVESVSIVREEIDGAQTLFQSLQATLLEARGSPWAVRWFDVGDALIIAEGEARSALAALRREMQELAGLSRERERKGDKGGGVLVVAPIVFSAAALAAFSFLIGRASLANSRR